jgi:hypothetical protein
MSQAVVKKKPYATPTVTNLGKVSDLTKGVAALATPDGGAISK